MTTHPAKNYLRQKCAPVALIYCRIIAAITSRPVDHNTAIRILDRSFRAKWEEERRRSDEWIKMSLMVNVTFIDGCGGWSFLCPERKAAPVARE